MRKSFTLLLLLCAGLLLCSACGKTASNSRKQSENAQQEKLDELQQEEEKQKTDRGVSLIVKHDLYNYQITLMDLTDASTICDEYTEGTDLFNQYGGYT